MLFNFIYKHICMIYDMIVNYLHSWNPLHSLESITPLETITPLESFKNTLSKTIDNTSSTKRKKNWIINQ